LERRLERCFAGRTEIEWLPNGIVSENREQHQSADGRQRSAGEGPGKKFWVDGGGLRGEQGGGIQLSFEKTIAKKNGIRYETLDKG